MKKQNNYLFLGILLIIASVIILPQLGLFSTVCTSSEPATLQGYSSKFTNLGYTCMMNADEDTIDCQKQGQRLMIYWIDFNPDLIPGIEIPVANQLRTYNYKEYIITESNFQTQKFTMFSKVHDFFISASNASILESYINGNTDCTEEVACTMDATQCPDGSWVGRTGPNCQFVCPTPNQTSCCGYAVLNGKCTALPECFWCNPNATTLQQCENSIKSSCVFDLSGFCVKWWMVLASVGGLIVVIYLLKK